MTSPRIVVRYFGPGSKSEWLRMVRVLTFTARQHCPGWALDVQQVPPSPLASPLGLASAVHNTQKLDEWDAAVQRAAPGDRLLLLDADMAILRPLDPAWEADFDLAYTVKPKESRMPFNAGAIFVRVSPATRTFIAAWAAENRKMFDDPAHHQVWRPCYGGLNQAALGALLHRGGHKGLNVRRLACLEWNCEDEHWGQFDPKVTRVLHVKGELQRAVFARCSTSPETKPLVALWRSLEADAMDDETRTPPPATPEPEPAPTAILPEDRDDQMIRPGDIHSPVMPPLSRRQRRRGNQPNREIGHAP